MWLGELKFSNIVPISIYYSKNSQESHIALASSEEGDETRIDKKNQLPWNWYMLVNMLIAAERL